jgi:hypothetical protein
MHLALVPSARLAANADSRVDDSWPVVVDRLRLIRIELLDLSAWAQSATTRTAVVITASRSLRRFLGAALLAHIAVFAFGTEPVPLNECKTADGGGRGLALRRLLPLAEEQVRALAGCHQQQQQQSRATSVQALTTTKKRSTGESSNSKAAATRSTRTASRSKQQSTNRKPPPRPRCFLSSSISRFFSIAA